jgi:CO/xanthine dehydrogenase FAD-binding subunit
MRSEVTQYDLIAAPSLGAALETLAQGTHTPIAGGTEIMVALGVGRLAQKRFVNIQALKELRFLREQDDAIEIGAGTTFSEIRNSKAIAEKLPLLARAASWTGSVANQNRGTLGGNIANASPAADSPPALLAYDARITLVSAGGQRTLPYSEFHLGYKKTALRGDELIYSVTVPMQAAGARHFIRKVGTRNAQAISKVALACVADVDGGVVRGIRIGAASLADRPVRCYGAEAAVVNARVDDATIRRARAALAGEARPIDDIRSTAKYRAAVAENLLEEFLRSL